MEDETVLYGLAKDAEVWQEEIITIQKTNDPMLKTNLQKAQAWAEGKGYHNFRIVHFGNEKPDFTKVF